MNFCLINHSNSGMGSLLYSQDNYAAFSVIANSEFFENKAEISLFDIYLSGLILSNVTFLNNSNVGFYSAQSNLNFSNVSFQNHLCMNIEGCIFSLRGNSSLHVKNSIFENIHNLQNEGNIFSDSSCLIFEQILMRNMSTYHRMGSCFAIYASNVSVSKVFFEDFSGNCIHGTQSRVLIQRSTFTNRKNSDLDCLNTYGAVFLINCFIFEILDVSLINNVRIPKGASVYISNDVQIKQEDQFRILNCTFQKNSATIGGAIFSQNLKILINFCYFDNNFAQKGGAIYLNSECILF